MESGPDDGVPDGGFSFDSLLRLFIPGAVVIFIQFLRGLTAPAKG